MFFILDAFLENLVIFGRWLIFTSEAFKMTTSAVHVQSLLTGPSHHGSFQWNPPDITIRPGTGIPRANRKKRARSSPIWLANCQPIPIFRYIASSPPILVSMSPSSASWVQSPWRIKFSPGCCSGKVGIVLWWNGVKNHSGVSLSCFGPCSTSCLQMAPISEPSVILWQEFVHFSLAPSLGWRGMFLGFTFCFKLSQLVSQLPKLYRYHWFTLCSSSLPLRACTFFIPFPLS